MSRGLILMVDPTCIGESRGPYRRATKQVGLAASITCNAEEVTSGR